MNRLTLLLGIGLVVAGSGCGSATNDRERPGNGTVAGKESPSDMVGDESRHGSWIDDEALRRLTGDRREALWKNAWRSQRRLNRWPSVLSQRFHACINVLDKDAEIPPWFLNEYRGFVELHVSGIKHIDEAVDWNEDTYAKIQVRFSRPRLFSSIQVRLAQEDLWCYESILQTIAWVNRKASVSKEDAPAIARIETLEVGQPAATAFELFKQAMALRQYFGVAYEWHHMGNWEPEGISVSGEDESEFAEKPPGTERSAETGRYVDLAGNRLAADVQPYPEFNLLPVHIVVVMDRGMVSRFLDQLSRCEMPVDVRHVTIRDRDETATLDTPIVILPPKRDYINAEILGAIRIFNPPVESLSK